MDVPGAERRVEEIGTLVECQHRLIEQLVRGDNDVTPAKIIFDRLRVSLSFYYMHMAACVFGIFRHVALCGGVTPLPTNNDFLNVISPLDIDGVSEHLDKASVVPDESGKEKTDDQLAEFGFCPLNEKEKREFMDSLGANGVKLLAELMGKETPSEPVAANQNLKSAKSTGRV